MSRREGIGQGIHIVDAADATDSPRGDRPAGAAVHHADDIAKIANMSVGVRGARIVIESTAGGIGTIIEGGKGLVTSIAAP